MSIVILSVTPTRAAPAGPTPSSSPAGGALPAGGACAVHVSAHAAGKAGAGEAFRKALLKELGISEAAAPRNRAGKTAPGKDSAKGKSTHHDRPDAAVALGVLAPSAWPAPVAPAAKHGAARPEAAQHATSTEAPARRAPRLRRDPSLGAPAAHASRANDKAASKPAQHSEALPAPGAANPGAPTTAPHGAVVSVPAAPQPGAAAPPPAPPMPTALTVGIPLAHAGWGSGFADRIAWMANQGVQHAELHLNPPDLGPLQVSLTVHNHQASAQFVSHHAAVREAVEAALPKLKDMLAGSGIALGSATVGSDASGGGASDSRHGATRRAPHPQGAPLAPLSGTTALRLPQGVVDIFA